MSLNHPITTCNNPNKRTSDNKINNNSNYHINKHKLADNYEINQFGLRGVTSSNILVNPTVKALYTGNNSSKKMDFNNNGVSRLYYNSNEMNSNSKDTEIDNLNNFNENVFDDEYNTLFDSLDDLNQDCDFIVPLVKVDDPYDTHLFNLSAIKEPLDRMDSNDMDLTDNVEVKSLTKKPKFDNNLIKSEKITKPNVKNKDKILPASVAKVNDKKKIIINEDEELEILLESHSQKSNPETISEKIEKVKLWFRNDIRQSYCQLLGDAFNTLNFKHLKNILYKYCFNLTLKSNNTKLIKNSNTQDQREITLLEYFYGTINPMGPNYRIVRGIESIGNYLQKVTEALPDVIFTLIDVKLRKIETIYDSFYNIADSLYDDITYKNISETFQSTNNNVLLARYHFFGTKLYDVNVQQEKLKSKVRTIKNKNVVSNNNITNNVNNSYYNQSNNIYNNIFMNQFMYYNNNLNDSYNNISNNVLYNTVSYDNNCNVPSIPIVNNAITTNIPSNFVQTSPQSNKPKKYNYKEADISLIPTEYKQEVKLIGTMVIPLTSDGKIIRLEFHYKNAN